MTNFSCKMLVCAIGIILTATWMCDNALAQRGKAHGARPSAGRASMPSRGGGMSRPSPGKIKAPSRPSAGRTPSMSRPSTARPPSMRPSTGRPSTGRPSTGRPATGLPSVSRPSAGKPSNKLPNAGRPSTGKPPTSRLPGNKRPGQPSLTRPSTGRPTKGQLNDFLDLKRPTTRPSTKPGNAAGDFLQNRPTTLPAQRPGVGGKPSQLPEISRPQQRPPQSGRPPSVRPPVHYPVQRPPGVRPPGYRPPGQRPPAYRPPGYRPPRPVHLPAYGSGYWGRYPNYRWRWGYYPNNNWWAWATAGAITARIFSTANTQPIYYDYGTTTYYVGDTVYNNGDELCSADEYSTQAQTIAQNIPEVDPESVDWLPLGVFALTEKDGSVEDATLYLQLALSKEGIIAGTFQNTATGKSFEVEGTVDEESQRAAWGAVGEKWPVMETGIYNLTENQAGALLHFESGVTQQWSMVRLDEPKDE